MNKRDSEQAIRYYAREWAKNLSNEERQHPSFSEFMTWLYNNGHGHYLNFSSVAGAEYDAERWFDEEMGLTWRR